MHRFDDSMESLARRVFDIARERRRQNPPALNGPWPRARMQAALAGSVTPGGIGVDGALERFTNAIAPGTLTGDHPTFFAFIPHAPAEASILANWLVDAFPAMGGNWLEGSGYIQAENEALRWLADCAGYPPESGGVFVSGGTAGNLAALHTARDSTTVRRDGRPSRWAIVVSSEAHISVSQMARVLDVDVITAAVDARGRMTGDSLRAALDQGGDRIFAVVATAGVTNLGAIDDLPAIGAICRERGMWFHIDGAYGLAVLASPRLRPLAAGVELSDSFIVDPHKWLFGPYDACALLYRDPALARAAHTQHAAYLDVYGGTPDWHPSDYAVHLSRRVRGFPFWFSLAVYGTDAYAAAIETGIELAGAIAAAVRTRPYLELLAEPALTVVLFRRRGWTKERYSAWSTWLLEQGLGLVTPSIVNGETVIRMVALNPNLTRVQIDGILDTLEHFELPV